MDRDDIIRMAREAGFTAGIGSPALKKHERFAALVAAAERENMAQWIEKQRNDIPANGWEFAAAIRARGEA